MSIISKGKFLSFVRAKFIEWICQTDILVTVNAASDLRALGLTGHDMKLIYHKIRDVGLVYSPRLNRQPMSLRNIVFLYFGRIVQANGGTHSPQLDATSAIWLYFYRMEEIEKQLSGKSSCYIYTNQHEVKTISLWVSVNL